GRSSRSEVRDGLVLEHHGQEQIAVLGALGLVLEQTVRASEPACRRADLAAGGELEADPDGAASGADGVAFVEVPLMSTLEPRRRLVVATEHVGARREQLGVRCRERRLRFRGGERVVRLEPGPPRVGTAATLELVDSIPHAAAHCARNLNSREERAPPARPCPGPGPGHGRGEHYEKGFATMSTTTSNSTAMSTRATSRICLIAAWVSGAAGPAVASSSRSFFAHGLRTAVPVTKVEAKPTRPASTQN